MRCFLLFFFVLLSHALLTGCSLPFPRADLPQLSGRVMLAVEPVSGLRVAAYPLIASDLSGSPLVRSLPSDAAGHFSLALAAGRYYLVAEGHGLYAFYGRNPITLPATGLTDLNIGLVRIGDKPENLEPMVVNGAAVQLTHLGEPLAGATLYAYLDLTSELKGMGYAMAGPSDAEGIAELALQAGTYYILARKRQSGAGVGPLRAGDFVGYYPGNPVHLQQGQVLQIGIPMLEVPQKVASLQRTMFGTTALTGQLLDTDGKPVAGARAVLYRDVRMLNRPDFVSLPTGSDGRFILSLPEGGHYYLAGRNTLGGAPGPGDLYGTYNLSPDHSLQVETGKRLENLEVVLEEMW